MSIPTFCMKLLLLMLAAITIPLGFIAYGLIEGFIVGYSVAAQAYGLIVNDGGDPVDEPEPDEHGEGIEPCQFCGLMTEGLDDEGDPVCSMCKKAKQSWYEKPEG